MRRIQGNAQALINPRLLSSMSEEFVKIGGPVHRVRRVGGLHFVLIRMGKYIVQCVIEPGKSTISSDQYEEGKFVEIEGIVRCEEKAPYGAEIAIESLKVVSVPSEQMPFSINKKKLELNIETKLDFRPISLRHPMQQAIFRIQTTIALLFREALRAAGFTEIFTPKIVFAGAEGGSNVFQVKYFDRTVFLAQSPQFYKQMMVGVHGRVFEVGPVFRAEPHDTSRHLNEYISMDLEMGMIKSFEDIMHMETYVLGFIFDHLKMLCQEELALLDVIVPDVSAIPVIRLSEAIEIVSKFHKPSERGDLDAESEKVLCREIEKETGSELVFVTHYPTAKRPVYAMEDPEDSTLTSSFDLLFRGLEITTGGQRIHEYEMQVEKMKRFGYNPEDFESYLQIHKYGMPPHGGLGLGLERITMQLLKLSSAKETSLFPRTINRLTP
jgi:nondiscriminating aspartyl-tRNA synthetase